MLVSAPSTFLATSLALTAFLAPNVAARPSPARPADGVVETERFELVNRRLQPVPRVDPAHARVKRATTTKKTTTTRKTTTTTKKTSTKVKLASTTTTKKTTTLNSSAAAASSRSAYSSSSRSLASSRAAAARSYSTSSRSAASAVADSLASFTRFSASAFSSASRYSSSSAAAATAAAASFSSSSASAYTSSSRSAFSSAWRATSLASYSSSSAAASLSLSASLSSSRSRSAAAAVKTLATGDAFLAGSISSTFRWQASGLFTVGCPWGVPNLDITTCYHLYLNATGNLQGTTGAATERRDWDPEEDAAMFDDHLESYFEAFPEQVPDHFASDSQGRSLHKRQIASCKNQVVSTVVPTTYTTVTTVTATSDVPAATATPPPESGSSSATGTDDGTSASGSVTDVPADSGSVTTDTIATTTTVVSSTTFTTAVAATTTPPSPRQRTEMLSWPGAAAGQTWSYTWKSYQSASTGTGKNFFHGWQLLRRDFCGGPVVTLDYENGQAIITDIVRPDCPTSLDGCPSVPVSQFFGRTMRHSVTVTYGLLGSFDYSVVDVADSGGTPLIAYSAVGDMGASGSIKFGDYRLFTKTLTDAEAFLGDYSAKRLA